MLTSVGTTVSGLGTTVTSTVSQIESALPPVAPVTAVLGSAGTTLSSIGHVDALADTLTDRLLSAAELVRRNRQESRISAAQTTVRRNCPLIVQT